MKNLVIGQATDTLKNTHTITDIYEGFAAIESQESDFIFLNLLDISLNDDQINRLEKVLQTTKTPILILSNQVQIQTIKKAGNIKICEENIDSKKIQKFRKKLIRFQNSKSFLRLIFKNKYKIIIGSFVLLLALEPLFKIIHFNFMTRLDLIEPITDMKNIPKLLEFWLLFPLGAFALYKRNLYSITIFSLFHLYSKLNIFKSKHSNSYLIDHNEYSLYCLIGLNLCLLIYIAKFRKSYRPIKKEQFRQSKRHFIEARSSLKINGIKSEVLITNISDTGAMIKINQVVLKKSHLKLCIQEQYIECTLAREINFDLKSHTYTYGVKFNFSNEIEKSTLFNFIKTQELRFSKENKNAA